MKKQSDGRYRTKVKVGDRRIKTEDGIVTEPVIKWASGRTQKELDENIEELKRRYVNGVEVERDVLWGNYAQEWYDLNKKGHLSESSKRSYSTYFNKYLFPAFGDRQMRSITAGDLQTFLNGFEGRGETTIVDICSIITNTFTIATAQGILDRNPALGLVKPDHTEKERRALTDAEAKAVLKVAGEHEDGLLLQLLYYTGARRGEALGVRWSDIDFAGRKVRIERDIDYVTNDVGTVKTEESVRSVPLPDELYTALNAVRGIGDAYIIQAPRTHEFWPKSTFDRRWEDFMAAVYEADPKVEHKTTKSKRTVSILTAHYFRHNYASILYNAGVDVLTAQRYLGHTKVETTLGIYAHLAKEKEQKGAKKVMKAFKIK